LLAVKAVHLELVGNLTSDAFIAALHRFITQRGKCLNFYSDSGTTFGGVHHKSPEFRAIFASRSTSVKTFGICKFRSIYMVYIPPHSPNFGELWEDGGHCMQFHLKRLVGFTAFTFKKLSTLLTQVEACLILTL